MATSVAGVFYQGFPLKLHKEFLVQGFYGNNARNGLYLALTAI
jgi:hypothetical protein